MILLKTPSRIAVGFVIEATGLEATNLFPILPIFPLFCATAPFPKILCPGGVVLSNWTIQLFRSSGLKENACNVDLTLHRPEAVSSRQRFVVCPFVHEAQKLFVIANAQNTPQLL